MYSVLYSKIFCYKKIHLNETQKAIDLKLANPEKIDESEYDKKYGSITVKCLTKLAVLIPLG